MKTSKVTQVTPNGEWQSQNGIMYKWNVVLENGDQGGVMTKTNPQTKWVVGKDVNYTLEIKGNFTNLKLVETNQNIGGSKFQPKDEGTIAMLSCISSACTAVAQGMHSVDSKFIINMANDFFIAAQSKSTLNK